jgi:hypothetical protein
MTGAEKTNERPLERVYSSGITTFLIGKTPEDLRSFSIKHLICYWDQFGGGGFGLLGLSGSLRHDKSFGR